MWIIILVMLNGAPHWPDEGKGFDDLKACERHGEHVLEAEVAYKGYVCIKRTGAVLKRIVEDQG